MLLSDELDANTVAAEVLLLRAAADKTILILEGGSDGKLFASFIDERQCEIVIAGGKESAVSAVFILERRGILGIICIVDQDYDSFINAEFTSGNIIVTELHDIELILVRSPALDKVIRELGSRNKINALRAQDTDVRNLVLSAIHPVGILRLYSLMSGVGLKFEGLRYQFISRDMECDVSAMVAEVFNHSRKQRPSYTEVVDFISRRLDGDHNPWLMCCGHDFVAALGRALQKVLGSMNVSDVAPALMESRLRLAFGAEEFCQTDLYREIKEWERRNVPYVCLRL